MKNLSCSAYNNTAIWNTQSARLVNRENKGTLVLDILANKIIKKDLNKGWLAYLLLYFNLFFSAFGTSYHNLLFNDGIFRITIKSTVSRKNITTTRR